jgi:ribosomal protein L4
VEVIPQLPGVQVTTAANLNAADVIGGGLLVVEKEALAAIAKRVAAKQKTGGAA